MLVLLLLLFLIVKCICGEQYYFEYCIKQQPSPGVMKCIGKQALHTLNTIEESENLTLANGLILKKDDDTVKSRILPNFLDQDPSDFRGILENAGAVISERTMEWDLSRLYPGLMMRIGPTLGVNGILEFVMDNNKDRTGFHEETSTARILTKSLVLPFLLGIKFHIATLIPLVIAGFILLTKKAAFLGKIALLLSGLLGGAGFLSPAFVNPLGGGYGGGYGYRPPYRDSHQDSHHHHQNDYHDYGYTRKNSEDMEKVKPPIDNFYKYEKQLNHPDQIKLYERELDTQLNSDANQQNNYRSFAWKTN